MDKWVRTWCYMAEIINPYPNINGRLHYNDVTMGPIASQITRLFGCRSKKTSKLRVTGLCVGNSPVTGEFPAQMAGNALMTSSCYERLTKIGTWISEYVHGVTWLKLLIHILTSTAAYITMTSQWARSRLKSPVYSGADQRKHQSSASLAFVREIHRGPVNSPHKWPITRKMFPFDDVIM